MSFAHNSPERRREIAARGGRAKSLPPKIVDRVMEDARDEVVRAARNWSKARNVTDNLVFSVALEARVHELEDLIKRRRARDELARLRGTGGPRRQKK